MGGKSGICSAPKTMSDNIKWYVVHTYSGHENKVKANLEKIVENRGMQDVILDIAVPTEDTIEIKNGQKKIKTRKMFPGYVVVKMDMNDDSWVFLIPQIFPDRISRKHIFAIPSTLACSRNQPIWPLYSPILL
jgi:hypothetical protein